MVEKIKNVLSYAFLIVSIILLVFIGFQRFCGRQHPMVMGYGFGVVVSDSMVPELQLGDIVVISKNQSFDVDDIIVYIDEKDRSITHRVVEKSESFITTQGDANTVSDRSITYDQVVGTVVYHFPGIILLAVVTAILLIINIILCLEKGDNKHED